MARKVGVLKRSFVSSGTDRNSQDPADTASISNLDLSTGLTKHIAFLFDWTLSIVMMRDLVPKVGRLSRKSLDSFLTELEKVQNTDEEKVQTAEIFWSGTHSEKHHTVSAS